MQKCGLLGKKLGHSYSPEIHRLLDDYEYRLYEMPEDKVEDFLKNGDWSGLNVTMPYKKTVVPFMDELGEAARKTGAVNTIVKDENGRMKGDNTDVYGFTKTVRRLGVDITGKKTLVLGSGGASAAVCCALKTFGIDPVVISRTGKNNYTNLDLHYDAEVIVNATPVGMYPDNGSKLLDLAKFPKLCAVFDVVYNPCRTALLLQAEKLGIPYESGLYMLICQAKKSSEIFTGKKIEDHIIDDIYKQLKWLMKNIVLIGMPGCGKSTTAEAIGKITGHPVVDSDYVVTETCGRTAEQIILDEGEAAFRKIETGVLAKLGMNSHTIISTGGGVVTREENYPLLHQNGTIVWLKRDLDALPSDNRPLSVQRGVKTLYREREPLYRWFADIVIDLDHGHTIEELVDMIKDSI